MGVSFYLENPKYWSRHSRNILSRSIRSVTIRYHYKYHYLAISSFNFGILRDLLQLPSPNGEHDYSGKIGAEELLQKIANARATLRTQGVEWERKAEPPPEGQENRSIKIMGIPGLSQDRLHFYLDSLLRIAQYAKKKRTGVKWS